MPTVIMLLVSELGRTLSIVGNDEVIDLMKIYLISGNCGEYVPGTQIDRRSDDLRSVFEAAQ